MTMITIKGIICGNKQYCKNIFLPVLLLFCREVHKSTERYQKDGWLHKHQEQSTQLHPFILFKEIQACYIEKIKFET